MSSSFYVVGCERSLDYPDGDQLEINAITNNSVICWTSDVRCVVDTSHKHAECEVHARFEVFFVVKIRVCIQKFPD
jgi:hypothetical protein